ncbi:MAG: methyltransferase domain-containing protein [Chloroflexi bacterium]|nr:methyltransferase domain-containing protein [Chloroflexota bacterium]
MASESVKFDRAVDYYDQTRGFPPGEEAAIGALIARVGSLSTSSRVLEIGVGTGRIALPVAPHVSAYYGIDLSRGMMERLRTKRNGEPIYVVEGDATRLPFPDNAFDGAVAVHVFHLIAGWRDVLRELERVLNTGAPLVHAWTRSDNRYQSLWDAFKAVIPPERNEDVGVHWKNNSTFLEDEGWQPVGPEQTHNFVMEQSALDVLKGARARLWSSTWRLTDDELERGVAAMQAAIEREYPQPGQPLRLTTTFVARAYLPANSF